MPWLEQGGGIRCVSVMLENVLRFLITEIFKHIAGVHGLAVLVDRLCNVNRGPKNLGHLEISDQISSPSLWTAKMTRCPGRAKCKNTSACFIVCQEDSEVSPEIPWFWRDFDTMSLPGWTQLRSMVGLAEERRVIFWRTVIPQHETSVSSNPASQKHHNDTFFKDALFFVRWVFSCYAFWVCEIPSGQWSKQRMLLHDTEQETCLHTNKAWLNPGLTELFVWQHKTRARPITQFAAKLASMSPENGKPLLGCHGGLTSWLCFLFLLEARIYIFYSRLEKNLQSWQYINFL